LGKGDIFKYCFGPNQLKILKYNSYVPSDPSDFFIFQPYQIDIVNYYRPRVVFLRDRGKLTKVDLPPRWPDQKNEFPLGISRLMLYSALAPFGIFLIHSQLIHSVFL
jgi:hypothetical protein